MSDKISDKLLARAKQWFKGEVDISHMQVLLKGWPNSEVTFYCLCCLYLAQGRCVVAGSERAARGGLPTLPQMYAYIRDLEVPTDKLQTQQALWAEHLLIVPPHQVMWETSVGDARALALPVGIIGLGVDHNHREEKVVVLQVLLAAPLDIALAEFKKATGGPAHRAP